MSIQYCNHSSSPDDECIHCQLEAAQAEATAMRTKLAGIEADAAKTCKWFPDPDYPDYRLRTECGHGTPKAWLGDGFNFVGCPYCMHKIEMANP